MGCNGVIEDAAVPPAMVDDEPLTPGLPFQLEPRGPSLQPGIRGLTPAELSRAALDRFGVEPDVSGLATPSEEYYLGNDAARLALRGGLALHARLQLATEVASVAPLETSFPCAAATCSEAELRAGLERALSTRLSDEALRRYLALYDRARSGLGDEGARRAVIQAALMSADFQYRTELGDAAGRLTPTELAQKLSFFLWGRPPDDALLAAAFDGSLHEPGTYEAHVDRLLADSRTASRLVEFVFDWLGLDGFDLSTRAGADELPEGTEAAMVEEVRRLVTRELFTERRGLRSLLTSSTTVVDDRVAQLYGLDAGGSGWREVSLAGTDRRGLLTTPLVLAAHAKESGRSPMQRGHFLVSELMCTGFGADFGEVTAQLPADPGERTFREQFASLLEVQPCSNCHETLNAGFALDLFDNVGRRHPESVVPSSEAAGMFHAEPYDAVHFSSTAEAVAAFADHPLLTRCFVAQAFRYAQGSRSSSLDRDTLEALERAFEDDETDVLALFRRIALSERFRAAVAQRED
ncbi:MAG: DUF1592 domain-containing protein [Myxococcota bacterium]